MTPAQNISSGSKRAAPSPPRDASHQRKNAKLLTPAQRKMQRQMREGSAAERAVVYASSQRNKPTSSTHEGVKPLPFDIGSQRYRDVASTLRRMLTRLPSSATGAAKAYGLFEIMTDRKHGFETLRAADHLAAAKVIGEVTGRPISSNDYRAHLIRLRSNRHEQIAAGKITTPPGYNHMEGAVSALLNEHLKKFPNASPEELTTFLDERVALAEIPLQRTPREEQLYELPNPPGSREAIEALNAMMLTSGHPDRDIAIPQQVVNTINALHAMLERTRPETGGWMNCYARLLATMEFCRAVGLDAQTQRDVLEEATKWSADMSLTSELWTGLNVGRFIPDDVSAAVAAVKGQLEGDGAGQDGGVARAFHEWNADQSDRATAALTAFHDPQRVVRMGERPAVDIDHVPKRLQELSSRSRDEVDPYTKLLAVTRYCKQLNRGVAIELELVEDYARRAFGEPLTPELWTSLYMNDFASPAVREAVRYGRSLATVRGTDQSEAPLFGR